MEVKNFKKLLKVISKDKNFLITSSNRKTTIKIQHIESGELYSTHPADYAVPTIKRWIKNKNNGK